LPPPWKTRGYEYEQQRKLLARLLGGTQTGHPSVLFDHTSLPGDANGDGKVNDIDHVVWLYNRNAQTSNGPSNGDFNYDGKVDGIDYLIWLINFGY
jgi:hypothetical protein